LVIIGILALLLMVVFFVCIWNGTKKPKCEVYYVGDVVPPLANRLNGNGGCDDPRFDQNERY
jgi:hypothetical protein